MRSTTLLLLVACAPVAEVDREPAEDATTCGVEPDTDSGAIARPGAGCLDAYRTKVTWSETAGEDCSSRHPLDRFLGDEISVDLVGDGDGGWSLALRFVDAQAGPSSFLGTSDDGEFEPVAQDAGGDTSFAGIYVGGTIDGEFILEGRIYIEDAANSCPAGGSFVAPLPQLACPRG